jgi:D-cysteine desulfhydrase family pyridoxal phosphate-dependent enzyme
MLTDHLPRVSLAHLPTPIEELSRLRQVLGNGPRLLIKRDDQTGLATGGNKTRKLEFVVAEALAQGADTLVTAGGPQSNHCRQTAAAAARLGLRCVLVLSGPPIPQAEWQGNLLLDALLAAEIRWSGGRSREAVLAETAAALQAEGARPYVIPVGASMPVGAVGYVAAVEELAGQLAASGLKLDRMVFTSGSAGTHAGLVVGVKALGLATRVEGICDDENAPHLLEKIKGLAAETADYLGLKLRFDEADFILHGQYGRVGYGVITPAEQEAIRLMAQTEGIIIDPVYTARSLAGLIDLIRRGVYAPTETVLFWHTGGVAGLFARAAELMKA